MAGVKGRSGGKRIGAGRKPARAEGDRPKRTSPKKPAAGSDHPTALLDGKPREPLEFLELVMNDPLAPLKDRIRAGVAAAQYRHLKRGDAGKKDEQGAKAKRVASGRFKAAPAPLKLVGGA